MVALANRRPTDRTLYGWLILSLAQCVVSAAVAGLILPPTSGGAAVGVSVMPVGIVLGFTLAKPRPGDTSWKTINAVYLGWTVIWAVQQALIRPDLGLVASAAIPSMVIVQILAHRRADRSAGSDQGAPLPRWPHDADLDALDTAQAAALAMDTDRLRRARRRRLYRRWDRIPRRAEPGSVRPGRAAEQRDLPVHR